MTKMELRQFLYPEMFCLPVKVFRRAVAFVFGFVLACNVMAAGPAKDKIDFGTQIRPIISAKCFHCHGPDESSRKAKLRLDVREDTVKERAGTRANGPGAVKPRAVAR